MVKSSYCQQRQSLKSGLLQQKQWSNIHNQYKTIDILGQGTYGVVYKAVDTQTGRFVALKRCRLDIFQDFGVPETTLREVALLADLNHKNIMKLHHISCNEDRLYLVCEYLELDLKKYIRSHSRGTPIAKIKEVTFELFKGLAFCHGHRVIHRDLKPHNILVSPDLATVKIADFGLARAGLVAGKTLTHEVITLWYRSPELLLGHCNYTSGVDIWSAGCIIAELLTLKPLFGGDSEIDTLFRILRLLGTPKKEDWPEHAVVPWEDFPQFPPKADPFASLSPELDDDGKDLLAQALAFSPRERLSAIKALNHPWFAELRAAQSEDEDDYLKAECELWEQDECSTALPSPRWQPEPSSTTSASFDTESAKRHSSLAIEPALSLARQTQLQQQQQEGSYSVAGVHFEERGVEGTTKEQPIATDGILRQRSSLVPSRALNKATSSSSFFNKVTAGQQGTRASLPTVQTKQQQVVDVGKAPQPTAATVNRDEGAARNDVALRDRARGSGAQLKPSQTHVREWELLGKFRRSSFGGLIDRRRRKADQPQQNQQPQQSQQLPPPQQAFRGSEEKSVPEVAQGNPRSVRPTPAVKQSNVPSFRQKFNPSRFVANPRKDQPPNVLSQDLLVSSVASESQQPRPAFGFQKGRVNPGRQTIPPITAASKSDRFVESDFLQRQQQQQLGRKAAVRPGEGLASQEIERECISRRPSQVAERTGRRKSMPTTHDNVASLYDPARHRESFIRTSIPQYNLADPKTVHSLLESTAEERETSRLCDDSLDLMMVMTSSSRNVTATVERSFLLPESREVSYADRKPVFQTTAHQGVALSAGSSAVSEALPSGGPNQFGLTTPQVNATSRNRYANPYDSEQHRPFVALDPQQSKPYSTTIDTATVGISERAVNPASRKAPPNFINYNRISQVNPYED